MPSTAIRHFTYDSAKAELIATFVTGRRYLYANVPPEIFTAFGEAPSKGAYFNAVIRDTFAYRELERERR